MNERENLTYPEAFQRFLKRCNFAEVNEEIYYQLSNEVKSLQFVKTCLSIGTGLGGSEIKFIKRCLPSLEKLIVVEKDPNCMRELKVNMENAFGDKIEIEYHEARIEDFMNENRNLSSKVDLILALYVLYFLTPENRKDLIKLCLDQWLESEKGIMILASPGKQNDFVTVYNNASEEMEFQDTEKMKNEMMDLGLNIVVEKTFSHKIDFREYDKDLYGMMRAVDRDISEGKIRVALEELRPDGNGQGYHQLFVVQRKN